MPQLQVLPGLPSFGDKLADALGRAAGQASQAFGQYRSQKNDQRIIGGFDPSMPAIDQIKNFAGLSREGQQTFAPIYDRLLQTQGAENVAQMKAQQQQQQLAAKEFADERERQFKSQQEALKKQEEQQIDIDALNRLDELLPQTGYTLGRITGLGKFSPKQVEAREEFDKTGFFLADKAYNKLNNGVISDSKLNLIKEDIAPNSKFTNAVNKARFSSLKRFLSLPQNTSEKEFDKILEEEKKRIASVGKSPRNDRPPLSSFGQ